MTQQILKASRGRPLIVNTAHFAGMTADPLLVDGSTCINIGGKDYTTILNDIRDAEANYPQWQQNVLNRFNEVVNFDAEFEKIKHFMENLI